MLCLQNFNLKAAAGLLPLGTQQQQPWASSPGAPTQPFPSNTLPPLPSSLNGNVSILNTLSTEQQHAQSRSPSLPPAITSLGTVPPGVSLPSQGIRSAVIGGGASGMAGSLAQPILGSSPHLPSSLIPAVSNPQTPAQQVLFSPADRYGLVGLLHIIKTSDPDLSMLALGSDLTTLGLDLGATECACSSSIRRNFRVNVLIDIGISTQHS